ncbi:unnamed protein product, partial [Allacma fusca]
HEVLRGRNDSEFSFSACENLEATTDLIDKAIVFVRCENYTNAFANFPLYKNHLPGSCLPEHSEIPGTNVSIGLCGF